MPWVLLPLLPLLTYYGRITESITLWPACLLVPVAVWLGRRFGTQGVFVTAIGMLAALLPAYRVDGAEFGGAPDIYVMALWACLAAAKDDPLRGLIGAGGLFRSPAFFVLALVVLPVSIWLGVHDFEDGASMSLYAGLRPLLLFGLLLFGLAGLPTRLAVAGLVAATIAGIAVSRFQVDEMLSQAIGAGIDPEAPWVNRFSLQYRWDDVAALVTGLACFFAGRTLKDWRAGARTGAGLWRRPMLAVAGLTLLAVAGTLVGQWMPDVPEALAPLGVYGDYYALPVASFMAGFLRRHLGVAAAFGLLLALLIGSNAAAYVLDRGIAAVSLEQPLLVLAFGTMGLRLRGVVDGGATTFKGMRWLQYAILVGGALAILTSSSELIDLAKAALLALGAALVGVLAQWLRGRLDAVGIKITGEAWLPFLVLLALTAGLAGNIEGILAVLTEALDDLDFPPGLIAIGALVLLHVPVALLAAAFARCLPKVWADIKAIRGASRSA